MKRKYKKKSELNLIFGHTGLISSNFYEYFKKKNKNFIIFSRQKKKSKQFITQNLNSQINFQKKKGELYNIYFFSSPEYLKKNNKLHILKLEFIWLKKIFRFFRINKLIYISSPSIFYKKSLIGEIKKKCEKYIILKKKKINFFQIWRPYNLLGRNKILSDHFHNLAIKKMFIEKKGGYEFFGSKNDLRGYSDVKEFIKILYKYSKKNVSFIKNYGNQDLISTGQIIEIYQKHYKKLNNRYFNVNFKSKIRNISKIRIAKNNVYSYTKSKKLIKDYIKDFLNEKKL